MPRYSGLSPSRWTLLICVALCGCATWGKPYSRYARCQLRPNMPLPELVEYLNQNINRLGSWRATRARIAMRGPGGVPLSISASLAIEAPRNFRLLASSLTGREVDLGSNPDQFWFWNRRDEQNKFVFTCRHDQLARAQQRFPIPFQPDWIMEALGVIPLNPGEFVLESGTKPHRARLIAQRVSPQGQPVTKVVEVDTCHGLVLEHALFDATGRLIARATLSGHYQDSASGVVLPGRVDLEWPTEQLSLAIHLGTIEVNPVGIPPGTWGVPAMPDYPIRDLGQP